MKSNEKEEEVGGLSKDVEYCSVEESTVPLIALGGGDKT
jgi:hypothetical protein